MSLAIVLAEDEADLRAIYAGCLRSGGFEVWEAADGTEALVLIAEKNPSLLVLDVWMPNLNGLEVLERLRQDPRATALKVVMLSNLADSDTRLECFASGVIDYWIKGFSLADLLARVRLVLVDAGESPGTVPEPAPGPVGSRSTV